MNRRQLLAALAAAPFAARAGSHASHWHFGDSMPRVRVGCLSNKVLNNVPSLALPRANVMYALPTSADALAAGAFFNESADVVPVGGCLVVQTPGRYRITASVDWPAQDGAGNGIRRVLVLRAPVGVAPPTYTPNGVTMVKDVNPYDKLGGQDWAALSADAWGMVTPPDEDLDAGEALFIAVRSAAPSDWIQCCDPSGNGSGMTFLQLEKIA